MANHRHASLLQTSLDAHLTQFVRHLDPADLDRLDLRTLEDRLAEAEAARTLTITHRKTWWSRIVRRNGAR